MSFISGAYSATWGGQPLGMVEGGFTLTYSKLGYEVTSDRLGRTVLDDIYMGMDVSLSFMLCELDLTGVNNLLWNVPGASIGGQLGFPGVSSRFFGGPLTMNACGAVNERALPLTVTFFNAGLKNGHEVRLAFTNRHRKASVDMRIYPVRDPNNLCQYRYFEAT
jgi:hypothetical protein